MALEVNTLSRLSWAAWFGLLLLIFISCSTRVTCIYDTLYVVHICTILPKAVAPRIPSWHSLYIWYCMHVTAAVWSLLVDSFDSLRSCSHYSRHVLFVMGKPCVRQSFFVCWGVFFVLHLRRSNKATPCWWWYLYNMLVAMNEALLSLRVGIWSLCLCVLFLVMCGIVSTLYCLFAMSRGQQSWAVAWLLAQSEKAVNC